MIVSEYLLIITLVSSILITIVSWRYMDLFLSRSDVYRSSRFDIFSKKIGWAITNFLFSFVIIFKLMEYLINAYK